MAKTLSTMTCAPAACASPLTARDVDELLHRVAGRLEEHHVGRRRQRLPPLVEVGAVDEVGAHAPPGQDLLEDHEARPEQPARGDDAVTLAEQRGHRDEHRGHARRRGEARLAPLEQAQPLLERGHGGVAVAGVDEVVGLALERGLGLLGAVVDEPGGQEERLGGLVEVLRVRPPRTARVSGRKPCRPRPGGRPLMPAARADRRSSTRRRPGGRARRGVPRSPRGRCRRDRARPAWPPGRRRSSAPPSGR